MGWLHLLLSTQARCELVGGPHLPSAFVGWSSLAGRGPADKQCAVLSCSKHTVHGRVPGGPRVLFRWGGMEEETLQDPYW